MPAQRLTRQTIPDQTVRPFEPLAHVGDPGGQIDPCSWAQSKHGLRPLQDAHQAFERTRIKIRMHFDPAPARQHHGQPTTRFLLLRRFPGRQLHRHQTTGRGNWLTPSLPTWLRYRNEVKLQQKSGGHKKKPPVSQRRMQSTRRVGAEIVSNLAARRRCCRSYKLAEFRE